MDSADDTDHLTAQRWVTGKDAVAAIKSFALGQGKHAIVVKKGGTFRHLTCSSAPACKWFINLSRYRSKEGSGDWHVSNAKWEHQNCMGVAKPTQHEIADHPVVRSSVISSTDVPAKVLVTQLRHQAGLTCSTTMIYRAKLKINAEIFSEDLSTIQLLPSLLAELLNLGTHTELERDESGHFKRAIVILNPDTFTTGQRLYGVDAAHMKHRNYNGVQIVMVGRDGNLSNRIAAIALAPVEDHDNYMWFFGRLMDRGFPLANVPVFSDRHKGIVSATTQLGVFNMFCVRHIIGNMRSDKGIKLSVTQERFVWGANASPTKQKFEGNIQNLADVNTAAAEYLQEIAPEKWALYPHYSTTPLYGWRTTNFVESEQARSLLLKPRQMLPYEYFKSYMTIMMKETYQRLKFGRTWNEEGKLTTPRAESKFQRELKDSRLYAVAFSSDTMGFVSRVNAPLTQRRVDVAGPICSCVQWLQHHIPCRHIIAVRTAGGKMDSILELAGSCYKVVQYQHGLASLEVPEEDKLKRDSSLKPAMFHSQSGRPRKRRVRSRGEDGRDSRVRKMYKCSRCGKTDGHNSASCRQTA